jgi:hypothetical protein
MTQSQKDPLRSLSKQEEQELRRIVNASSERVDVVRRVRALLAVAASQTFPQAASAARKVTGSSSQKPRVAHHLVAQPVGNSKHCSIRQRPPSAWIISDMEVSAQAKIKKNPW